MIRRLIAALLVLCLAVPALAVPAPCAPARTDVAMHHRHHHGDAPADMDHAARHECIGCATLVADQITRDPAVLPATTIPPVRHSVLPMRATSGPDSPPPKV